MKLFIASTFAIAATFSTLSAEPGCGGCKKKGDGCKKDELTLVNYQNEGDGCKKKKGGGCDDGCKKKKEKAV